MKKLEILIPTTTQKRLFYVDFYNPQATPSSMIIVDEIVEPNETLIDEELLITKTLETIRNYADNDETHILNLFNYNIDESDKETNWKRRLITKINAKSNYIASEGRNGQATTLILNPFLIIHKDIFDTTYEHNITIEDKDYSLTFVDKIYNISIYMDSRIPVDEIILLRKNDIDQPGLKLFYNNKKYIFKNVGYLYNKQYGKIKITFK